MMMFTIRSISFCAIGLVLLCSFSRLTTCCVNSWHACNYPPCLGSCSVLVYLVVLLQFCIVHASNLGQLGSIIGLVAAGGVGTQRCPFIGSSDAFCHLEKMISKDKNVR